MTDLFETVPPPYGSLSPSEEFALNQSNHPAWIRYVAAATARKLSAGGAESFAAAWPRMSLDYRKAVAEHLSESDRELVRLIWKRHAEATREAQAA